MKKIISAVALASLAAGLATADVKFALNYRTQAAGYSRVFGGNGFFSTDEYTGVTTRNAAYEKNQWWSNTAYGGDSDTVSFTVSNDVAGATARIDPKASDGSLTLNQYNGYVKLGAFELSAGAWKDGQSNGAYQLKNDSDAANYGGDTFAAIKLGSLFKGAMTTFVDDIVNFAGGSNASSAYLKYANDLGDGFLTVTGSLIGIGSNKWDAEGTIYTGFGLKADYKIENTDVQFVYKTASNKETATKLGDQDAFALHVNQGFGALKVTLGGSLGINNGNVTELACDLRARYASGPLSITSMNNVSHITNDNDYVTDIVKHVGAIYLSDAGALANAGAAADIGSHTDQTYATAMWNLFGLRYKINERFTALFSMGDFVPFNNALTERWTGVEAFVAPGVQIFAAKNASIVTYARFGVNHIGQRRYLNDDYTADGSYETALLIPVIIRVKF